MVSALFILGSATCIFLLHLLLNTSYSSTLWCRPPGTATYLQYTYDDPSFVSLSFSFCFCALSVVALCRRLSSPFVVGAGRCSKQCLRACMRDDMTRFLFPSNNLFSNRRPAHTRTRLPWTNHRRSALLGLGSPGQNNGGRPSWGSALSGQLPEVGPIGARLSWSIIPEVGPVGARLSW